VFFLAQRIVAESCEVALDVYESEQSNEFQYANGVEELAMAAH
jgi:deoxyhypusine monooxygenase